MYHNELGCLLIQNFFKRNKDQEKILEFLEKDLVYDASIILAVINQANPQQQSQLQRERAWLLARQGKRQEAFIFLIEHDLELACRLAENIQGFADLFRVADAQLKMRLLQELPDKINVADVVDLLD